MRSKISGSQYPNCNMTRALIWWERYPFHFLTRYIVNCLCSVHTWIGVTVTSWSPSKPLSYLAGFRFLLSSLSKVMLSYIICTTRSHRVINQLSAWIIGWCTQFIIGVSLSATNSVTTSLQRYDINISYDTWCSESIFLACLLGIVLFHLVLTPPKTAATDWKWTVTRLNSSTLLLTEFERTIT